MMVCLTGIIKNLKEEETNDGNKYEENKIQNRKKRGHNFAQEKLEDIPVNEKLEKYYIYYRFLNTFENELL